MKLSTYLKKEYHDIIEKLMENGSFEEIEVLVNRLKVIENIANENRIIL